VKAFAVDALSHRIILEPNLWGSKALESAVVEEAFQSLPVPVVPVEHD
jgi:hypothetical protein